MNILFILLQQLADSTVRVVPVPQSATLKDYMNYAICTLIVAAVAAIVRKIEKPRDKKKWMKENNIAE